MAFARSDDETIACQAQHAVDSIARLRSLNDLVESRAGHLVEGVLLLADVDDAQVKLPLVLAQLQIAQIIWLVVFGFPTLPSPS